MTRSRNANGSGRSARGSSEDVAKPRSSGASWRERRPAARRPNAPWWPRKPASRPEPLDWKPPTATDTSSRRRGARRSRSRACCAGDRAPARGRRRCARADATAAEAVVADALFAERTKRRASAVISRAPREGREPARAGRPVEAAARRRRNQLKKDRIRAAKAAARAAEAAAAAGRDRAAAAAAVRHARAAAAALRPSSHESGRSAGSVRNALLAEGPPRAARAALRWALPSTPTSRISRRPRLLSPAGPGAWPEEPRRGVVLRRRRRDR